jgi:diaminohydroxyphosphoribosylaminopyrimidine deaminase/5-amino-6-(5-phosphoribosylamino)uracil reductase
MSRALELARRGEALAHPNPLVGAVLVKNSRMVGEGFHTYDGRRHAEIVALENAGASARGATLYVNLEPCSHVGRTGPCTEAIRSAGVKRVVAAMKDPNPQVAGRGLRQLSQAGIEVSVGARKNEAQGLNEAFARWIRTGGPFVTMKSALTLDGRIATSHGSATWITSPASRAEVQQMRHAADALLTGIGTVLADNPRLTDRTGAPRRRKLLRVVIDSRLRLPLRSKLVKSADKDVVVFTTESAESRRALALRKAGVEVLPVRAREGHPNLREVLRELGRREILSVLLEAGPALNGAALAANVVDKVVLFFAPKILGGDAVPLATARFRSYKSAPALRNLTLRRFGPDFCVEGTLRDVYGDHSERRKN